ncbi:N-methyl-L-tryptophan oxidase [Chthonomonas calidirosea]|uniref:N-methyl-L-tryptophan oxidase n=1 Tax=Chthonomonas calidirosea TaxID=454171 RepID=UPI0006ECA6C3|nr:N-methyl-L-tryptophan oxidase [Chthonomonas calidirosea]CEK20155.1 glycine/D-amino acid oxidase, deaminating [Chthonomonas calidirosea]
MRVAVIGLGGTGSAACRYLAKRGHTVVGYEQFRVGNDKGSSYGESRAIRYGYADSFYTHLMKLAYRCWDELEAEANEELRVLCGSLFFGEEGNAFLRKTIQALDAEDIPYELLHKVEVERRFPAIRLAENELACYQAEGGFLRATRCVLANIRLAQEYGAQIREHTSVQRLIMSREQPIVVTAHGEEAYDRVIVTAGPWISKLFPELHLPLEVTRQQVVYLQIARHPERFLPGAFPVWIDTDRLIYGFPQDGQVEGVKLADHHLGESVDPHSVNRVVDESYQLEMVAYALKRFPDLCDHVTYSQVCLYTNTPNEDFILDSVPNSPAVWLVSGCSGHGFKFTALLGKLVALLATDSAEIEPTLTAELRAIRRRFALKRFLKPFSE